MPADGGRRGRRDNGLDAAAYVPLLDVDPRVGEHLLDVLGTAGVPAYLEPSADTEPYTRAYALPSPPTDRLWVDRERRSEARQIVDAENPDDEPEVGAAAARGRSEDEPSHGLADSDEERAWRDIIASFNAPSAPHRPLRPASPAAPDPTSPGRHRHPQDHPDPDGTTGPDGPGGTGGPDGTGGTGGPGRTGGPGGTSPPGATGGTGGPHPTGGAGGAGGTGGTGGAGAADEREWAGLPPWPQDEAARPRLPGRAPTGEDLDAAAAARGAAEDQAADAAAAEDDDIDVEGPPELDEGHFEPPPPPPVPRPSRRTVAGLVLIALGLLLLIAPGVIGMTESTGLPFGILSILGGGVVLVLGLRDTRGDDGPDDGAVV